MNASMIIDGKKFMWDGVEHPNEAAAGESAEKYLAANFETRTVSEGNGVFVLTRRVVTEIVIEGAPPA